MKKNQQGFSFIELLIVVIIIGVSAVIAVPNPLSPQDITANEASAIESMRTIGRAQAIYRSTHGIFAYNGAELANAGLLDAELGCTTDHCVKNGYVFTTYGSQYGPPDVRFFDVIATPVVYGTSGTGTRSFYTNEGGIIYYNGTAAAPVAEEVTRTVIPNLPLYNIFPNKFDFDRNGKSDLVVFRPSIGVWYLPTSRLAPSSVRFGLANDTLVPADYHGYGRTDFAVFRDGFWYIAISGSYGDSFETIQFGEATDIPVPADFDGDGKADVAVFRPSNGFWYLRHPDGSFTSLAFGQAGDKPVAGDFDGDGLADLAVFRPSEGIWYLQQSTAGFKAVHFGVADDKLVAADYDGDGRMDIAVYRPSTGTWYLNQSTAGVKGFAFGVATDLPVPADYNGDGKADIAVFRDGMWFIQESGVEQLRVVQYGQAGDKPAANAFVR